MKKLNLKALLQAFCAIFLMLASQLQAQTEAAEDGKYHYFLQNRNSFTKINISSNIQAKVRLVKYNNHRAEVVCDKDGEKQLEVYVKNFELFVGFKDPNANFHAQVDIELPVLNQITGRNGAEIDFMDEIKFKNLNVVLESKANTSMNLSAENISISLDDAQLTGNIDATKSTIRLANAAKLELTGHCTDIDAYADQQSSIKSQDLVAKVVFVKATNGSKVDIQANTSANIYALTDAVVNLHYKQKPSITSNIKQNGKLNEIKLP
jgi:Putative auto-transporter adhesin, head GIN domain